uniref:Uncharacterized protein n=1 Tax=Anopheles melas TaxID=34690 RepID=A0A182TLS9_9DIPT
MSNVECGKSSSNSVLKKLLLSELGPHSSEDELGLLRGDTIEPIDPADGPMPPLPAPIPPPSPEPPADPGVVPPGPAIPPPVTLMLPAVMPPPPSMPDAFDPVPTVPPPPPFSTLDISGPPMLLTPCRNSLDCVFTCTYTSGPPRRNRLVSSCGVPFDDRTLPRCSFSRGRS